MLYSLIGPSNNRIMKVGFWSGFRWSAPSSSRKQACQRCQPLCLKQIFIGSHWRPSPRRLIRENAVLWQYRATGESQWPQSTPGSQPWSCGKSAHCLETAVASQHEVTLRCLTKSLVHVWDCKPPIRQCLPSGESRTCQLGSPYMPCTITTYSNAFKCHKQAIDCTEGSCHLYT